MSHLGFVMLGLFALNPEGVAGAILQMVNHGLSTGALFLLIGMIYEQTHTREIKVYGGLWKITPIFGTLMLIASLSSMGLPGSTALWVSSPFCLAPSVQKPLAAPGLPVFLPSV